MRSMTGHGRAVSSARHVTVEVRSVNHRFFDLKIRAPGFGPEVEERIRRAVRAVAERGSFTVSLRAPEGAGGKASVRVDPAAARAAVDALTELRGLVGAHEGPSLGLVAAQPGVLRAADDDEDPDEVWRELEPCLEAALRQLADMRRREGEALGADIAARLDALEEMRARLTDLAAAAPSEHQERLRDRLDRLLGGGAAGGLGVEIDAGRLAQEIALLADRLDVTEELVRLGSHLAQARPLLADLPPARDGGVGRRLEFLVQEMGRELNTIGSKSQSAEIAAVVVDAKVELERIREQIQNVE